MAAPAVLGYGDPAGTSDRIVGPIVAAFSIIAASQVTRGVRWAIVPFGVWLLAAPWLLDYGSAAIVNSMVVALLLIALTPLGGRVQEQFGGGWSSLLPSRDSRST